MDLDEFKSSYEVYHQCRSRDLCLRYMGEEPARYADVSVTPCPCSPQFYREVLAFGKVLEDERLNGKLPYSHHRIVHWITQKQPRLKKPKYRTIPVSQMRLQ